LIFSPTFYYLLIFNTTTLEQKFYHIDDDLLVKHLLGEASPEEEQSVIEWLKEDATHKEYYNQFKKIWENSKELAAVSTIDENKAWQNFKQRIAGPKKEAAIVERNRFSWRKIAASVILLLGLTLGIRLLNNKGVKPVELITAVSEQNVLIDTLSDGSVVTLNKESFIKYPSKFNGDKRAISLKGEAFFNVAPDKRKPFIITVNDVQVEVVGTSFNVKNENGNTEVVVETGIVRVTKAGKTVQLAAGEKLLLSANDSVAVKEAVSDKLYNYYRSKEFVCDNTPLWKLVEVLNEAYDANISIGRKELNDLRLNTTFNNESLDKVLEIIHLTFDITVVRKEGQIILQ
jgi:transmembrane sensor